MQHGNRLIVLLHHLYFFFILSSFFLSRATKCCLAFYDMFRDFLGFKSIIFCAFIVIWMYKSKMP